jgi:broad specificity phosphatase PhoE
MMTAPENESHCTRLYLVRHGDTIDELTKKVYKGTIDIPLSSAGTARMKGTARYMSQAGLRAVYTSELSRSIESGRIIAAPHSLDLCVNGAFNEICFGEWEGKSFSEIQEAYPELFARWLGDPLQNTPPDGEPLIAAQERIVTGLCRVIEENRGRNVALVSHAGVLKIILSTFLMVPLPRMHIFAQDYGCVDIVDVYDDDNIVVRLLNHAPGR